MQAGFLCLESGFVRSKNSINVAAKNLIDLVVTVLIFWTIGFSFLFAPSYNGLIGIPPFFIGNEASSSLKTVFLFEVMFCATSVTIISGATAERMKFKIYILVSAIVAGLIYPILGHWAWGGLLNNKPAGWLELRGFVDFAGSSIVHSSGGWVALALIIILGPRMGRFDNDHRLYRGQNLTISTLGVIFLWIGWFGFNGGSTLELNQKIPAIIVNTLLGGAFGGFTACLISLRLKGIVDINYLGNGILAGLVSVTAACHALAPFDAALVGSMGGLVFVLVTKLLERYKIDDAIGAVPVHLGGGIWGTMAVGLFGQLGPLNTGLNRLDQLLVQFLGIGVCFVWSFGLSYIIFTLINRICPLRVSLHDEHIGLNKAEHDATTDLVELLTDMHRQEKSGDFSQPLHVEPFTEVGQIAMQYNRVLDKISLVEKKLVKKERLAVLGQLAATVSHELRNPLGVIRNSLCLVKMKISDKIGVGNALNRMDRSINRCDKIIGELLDYAHQPSSDFKTTDIDAWLEKVLKEQNIPEEITLKKDLKSGIKISIDPDRFRRAIINVCDNACQAMLEGKRAGQNELILTVHTQISEGFLDVIILDTGPGIPPDELHKILQPFYSTRCFGVGLGIPIVKEIVEQHGGVLKITSEEGKGTKVILRFSVDPSAA